MTRMMSSIFVKKYLINDYSQLGLDLHSHVLPGIDDGAVDVAASNRLLTGLMHLGFEKCIPTPHVSQEYYPNTNKDIFDAFDHVNAYELDVPDHYIQQVAAEYLLDENIEKMITEGSLLTLPGKRVLFELPFRAAPYHYEHPIFSMTTHGYTPVLAHPERYLYWHGPSVNHLMKLVDMGCELQLNILSLLGYYGQKVRQAAYHLLSTTNVQFMATDVHNQQQLLALREGLKDSQLSRLLNKKEFLNRELLESY